jgi:hypothetical protein
MKVGARLVDLMSKRNSKRISFGHRPVLYIAPLIALAASLALVGCGNISLSELLERQAPGELAITPQTATISPGSSLEIGGGGGFTPYTFLATVGFITETDGITSYTAPGSETPDVIITVVDALSNEATATIQVVTSTMDLIFPTAMTIAVGESTGYIQVSDGTAPYTFELIEGEGTLEPHPVFPEDRVKYVAPLYETTAVIHVVDATGMEEATLTITVVAASGP